MYPLDRDNVKLYEQISLNNVNTLLIDAVTVPVISEIRADQYVNKCQYSENERNPFSYSDITREISRNNRQLRSLPVRPLLVAGAGRIHTVQCPF